MAKYQWALDIPDMPYVTPNDRVHWSIRSACGAEWRRAAKLMAIEQKIPPLTRASIQLTMYAKDRRRRDEDNLVSGVLKHCLDGLVDAQVVPDDSPRYVLVGMPRIVPQPAPRKRHHVWILEVVALG